MVGDNPFPEFFEKRQEISSALKSHLGLDGDNNWQVSFGAGASYWLPKLTCHLGDNDFITISKEESNSTMISALARKNIHRMNLPADNINFTQVFEKIPENTDVLVLPVINSMHQATLQEKDLQQALEVMENKNQNCTVYLDAV